MYSVKKFCDMIGVPISTLRYYERIGLLDPKKNVKNNYREYTVQDAFKVNGFRSFRGMGFEAKETMEMLEEKKAELYYEKLMNRHDKIMDEMFLLQEQLFAVQHYRKILELAQSEQKYTISKRKDLYFLKASNGQDFSESTFEQFSKWVQLVPLTRYGKFIRQDDFYKSKLQHHIHYGIAMECQFEFLLDTEAKENMEYLKGGECIQLYTTKFSYGTDLKQAQEEIQDIVTEHGYELDGPIYMEGTRVEEERNIKGEFVTIPVRKVKDMI